MRSALNEMFVLPRLRIPIVDRVWSLFTHSSSKAEVTASDTDADMSTERSTSTTSPNAGSVDAAMERAFEEITQLRSDIRKDEGVLFWSKLIKGLARICKAQYTFVAKRTSPGLSEGYNFTTRLPALSYDNRQHAADSKAWDKGGKVSFEIPSILPIDDASLIADDLQSVIGEENMALLPFPMHAYLCMQVRIARGYNITIGLMWTREGLAQLDLSWTALRLLLHAVEELTKSRAKMWEFRRISKKEEHSRREGRIRRPTSPRQVQKYKYPSFRAFAPHLSHELRTPMQGVVGMFDVVHAEIEDISRDNTEVADRLKNITQLLEDAHDSAKRAVQAADNIIIAYELDMQVPDTPYNISDEDSLTGSSDDGFYTNSTWQQGSTMENLKRRTWTQKKNSHTRKEITTITSDIRSAVEEADACTQVTTDVQRAVMDAMSSDSSECSFPVRSNKRTATSIPSTRIRELIHLVIGESFHVGGRPEHISTETTDFGERFEVQARSSNGRMAVQKIEWLVDPCVPEELYVREKDLAKLVSCVFLNAVKFTETGEIVVRVTLDKKRANFVLINIEDTGTGIPEAFIPRLFEPFARENQSITRSSEGLGLGLLVAKGLSRRIGGDLTCVWSSTAPSNHGSNFEISVPIGKRTGNSGEHTPNRPKHPHSRCTSRSRSSEVISSTSKPGELSASFPAHPPPQLRISTQDAILQPAENSTPETQPNVRPSPRPKVKTSEFAKTQIDRQLAKKYPLNCLVAEDNKIVRDILVSNLRRLGYEHVYEAFDGRDAVEKMTHSLCATTGLELPCPPTDDHEGNTACELSKPQTYPKVAIDIIFMDIWLPRLDGFSAIKEILGLVEKSRTDFTQNGSGGVLPPQPTVLFTTADLSESLHKEVDNLGCKLLLKPYGIPKLQRAIIDAMAERATTSAIELVSEEPSIAQTETATSNQSP